MPVFRNFFRQIADAVPRWIVEIKISAVLMTWNDFHSNKAFSGMAECLQAYCHETHFPWGVVQFVVHFKAEFKTGEDVKKKTSFFKRRAAVAARSEA
ncbi:MAG: hypothetical protein E7051_07535 [Lentisphaerae bacterium]|nr:hypothetical protein [Lentisphaerota bacterium]